MIVPSAEDANGYKYGDMMKCEKRFQCKLYLVSGCTGYLIGKNQQCLKRQKKYGDMYE